MILTKKELKEKNIAYSREQISIRAIEIAEMCKSGSYKNAIACIGRMASLARTINEYYWDEKYHTGADMERYYLLSGMKETHPDKNTMI